MLHEKLYESDMKRIRLDIWKSAQGSLVMHLQEVDLDPKDPHVESFRMFDSWSVTVATEPCKRATQAAVLRFYKAHIAAAQEHVRKRVEVLVGQMAWRASDAANGA